MRPIMLTLADVVDNPDNPRSSLGPIDDLAASIIELGLLQPILVCPAGYDIEPGGHDTFMVVDGHRRVAAMRVVNYAKPFPAYVADMDRTDRLVRAVAAGSFARALSPVDQAKAFKQLMALGLTQKQVAERTGVSDYTVSTRLRILELKPEQQKAVDSGTMTLSAATAAGQLLRSYKKRIGTPRRKLTVVPDPDQHPIDLTFCLTVVGSTDHTQLGRDIARWFEAQQGGGCRAAL